jgi:GST-like protein
MVTTVTDRFEKDFEEARAKKQAVTEGFVPAPVPPSACVQPIVLYTWDTPNGKKASILLEELQLPYRVVTVHIGRNEQFDPHFLTVSPNNKIPAILDPNHTDVTTGQPLTVFESGALLLYLARTYGGGKLLGGPTVYGQTACIEWLFFQVGGFGPMPGQLHHFLSLAGANPPPITSQGVGDAGKSSEDKRGAAYGLERFDKETRRLYGVMDRRLGVTGAYFAGEEFSIADIAIYGWVWRAAKHKVDLAEYPHVKKWAARVGERASVQRGLLVPTEDEKARPRRVAAPEMGTLSPL